MPSRSPDSSNLFSAPESAPAAHTAHVDGGARGNPGPAGYGVAINDASGHPVAELSEYLGHRTNNYAEYQGLLAALRYATENQIKALKVISDSELMVRQMKGIYKVRHPDLRKLYEQAQQLVRRLEHFEIRHALREHNQMPIGWRTRLWTGGDSRFLGVPQIFSFPTPSPQDYHCAVIATLRRTTR